VLKRSRIFKSGINRRAMKAARESIALLTEEKQGKADYSSNYLVRKIFVGKHNQKSQSAMEYLMTYGWAILIIAVVLGALYSLGVFNSTNFAPKAPPGSCHVFRPNGPGTSFDLNLEGVCNGELPEYVASIPLGDGISVTGDSLLPLGSSARTIVMWFQVPANGGYLAAAGWFPPSCGTAGEITGLGQWNSNLLYFWGWGDDFSSSLIIVPHTWYFAAATYPVNGNTLKVTVYLDSNNQTGSISVPLNTQPNSVIYMGHDPVCGDDFTGLLANVQIYNTSLSPSEVQALYQEGIGGAPIDLQNLIGWWPLNGNANDYSGNGNNGVPSNVMFVSNWYSGYTPP
ncbi:MAG: LamG-like jellyroll fold domain-containing protein, partial [Candidatus Micrarchaeaceae archaeon]